MKNKFVLVFLTAVLMIGVLFAGVYLLSQERTDKGDALDAANQLYVAGHYQEAAELYEQLLTQGVAGAALYYNLGNAYYMKGDLGRAILNYQRASRLDPRDGDIQYNLSITRTQAGEDFTVDEVGPLKSLSALSGRWLTINETALIAVSLWFILAILTLIIQSLDGGKLRSTAIVGLIAVLILLATSGASLGSRLYVENSQPEAVVVAPKVTISSSPGAEFLTDLTLTSGKEVIITEIQGEWAQLSIFGSGFEGWIPLDTVEFISVNITGLQSSL